MLSRCPAINLNFGDVGQTDRRDVEMAKHSHTSQAAYRNKGIAGSEVEVNTDVDTGELSDPPPKLLQP